MTGENDMLIATALGLFSMCLLIMIVLLKKFGMQKKLYCVFIKTKYS